MENGIWNIGSYAAGTKLFSYGLDEELDVALISNKEGDIALINNTRAIEEQESFAKLIAASPDLLEACKDVVATLHGTTLFPKIFIACRDAINKATN